MGRAKLNMELIADKKSRNTTFNNRKEGLIKKTHELATLCDVSACIIIYGPKQESGSFNQPDIWPANADQVRGIITDVYKPSKNKDSSGSRTFGLPDFFNGRKRKIEGDLAKLRKKNLEAIYPTRPKFMERMSEPRMREFAASLSNKLDYVKTRIEFLRIKKQGLGLAAANPNLSHHGLMTQSHGRVGLGLGGIEQSQGIQLYPTIDHHRNSSMMMRYMMNGGGPSVDLLQPRQASYEVMGHGPRHYGPDLSVRVPYMPVVGPYMQMMPPPPLPPLPPPPPPPPLQLWARAENNYGQEDVVRNDQYQMNYKRARFFY